MLDSIRARHKNSYKTTSRKLKVKFYSAKLIPNPTLILIKNVTLFIFTQSYELTLKSLAYQKKDG